MCPTHPPTSIDAFHTYIDPIETRVDMMAQIKKNMCARFFMMSPVQCFDERGQKRRHSRLRGSSVDTAVMFFCLECESI